GPLLVTVIVYSTDSPGTNSVCPTSLVTFTVTISACGLGSNGGVSQSGQSGSGSSVGLVTCTAFTRSSVKSGGVCTVTVSVTVAPSGRLELVLLISSVPLVFGKVTVPVVTSAVQLLIAVPAGAVSVTFTCCASLG